MILVTGITGKSGSWFLKRLVQEKSSLWDEKFRIVIRNREKSDLVHNSDLSMEKVFGDINDEVFVKSIMENITTVLHIAGIHVSLKIVRAALANNVKRIILVHTTGIFSKYKSAGKEYLSIENEIYSLVKGKDINLTILRPTMIYGSVKDNNIIVFIKMVDKLHFFPVVNHANYFLQPVHEKDLGEAYYQVLINEKSTKNKSYNLSGKNPILLIDILKTIGSYLGKKNIFLSIPFPVAYLGGWIIYIISIGRIDYREKIQRLVEPRIFDHSEATEDFGFSPIDFKEGVRDEVEKYLNIIYRSGNP
jgi:nucleoside-diphosphate-sugar epimerase